MADVLKLYFRELPEPLLTHQLYDSAVFDLHKEIENIDNYLSKLSEMMQSLPIVNYCMLKYLVRHLYKVERYSSYNLMGLTNLSIVFGPTLLYPKNEGIEHTLMLPRVYAVIQHLIENYDIIFQDSFPVISDEITISVEEYSSILTSKTEIYSNTELESASHLSRSVSRSNFESSLAKSSREEVKVSDENKSNCDPDINSLTSTVKNSLDERDSNVSVSTKKKAKRKSVKTKLRKSISMKIPRDYETLETSVEESQKENVV